MDNEIDKLRKKIKKSFDIEVDESDIPVHEKRVKDEDIRMLKKRKR